VRVLARTARARPGTHGACASWHARRVRVLARTAGARGILITQICAASANEPRATYGGQIGYLKRLPQPAIATACD